MPDAARSHARDQARDLAAQLRPETEPALAARQALALVAASCAAEATTALFQFSAAGPVGARPFHFDDPIAELAQALDHALQIEAEYSGEHPEEREANGQLAAAIHKWRSDMGAL